MAFTLRPYQDEAVAAVIDYFRLSDLPALVVAATGAGKSLIVAELAKHYGFALVLHPSKELCAQNAEKYAAYDLANHSIYCAGLGKKDASGDVIFATHQSLDLDAMPPIKILIVDEAHKFDASMRKTYAALKERFPGLLMLGLTATPYLMGAGFIYRQTPSGRTLTREEARDPFFQKCVFEIGAEMLISMGYLCPLVVGDPEAIYSGAALEVSKSGWFTAESVEKSVTSDTKATAAIARQVLHVSDQRVATMVFTSSIDHAKDFMRHMPPKRARLITGETPARDRARWLRAFKAGLYDILVNVAVLTTGVDLPLVDTIAILRFTESAALWEQIVGRGMRLSPDTGKTDCLLLEYTENIDTFFPSGNIYQPEIRAVKESFSPTMAIPCPTCNYENRFKLARNEMGLPVSPDGYFLDLTGEPVRDDFGEKVIAHHGRRCQHYADNGARCDHRFVAKKCPSCKANNDIAARKCYQCEKPLVDWNKHLKKLAQKLPEKETTVGTWTIGRVEKVELNQPKPGAQHQAIFSVFKRKQPIRKWLGGTPTVKKQIQDGDVPHAIAFRKNMQGYNDVRVLWTPLDLDQFIQAPK